MMQMDGQCNKRDGFKWIKNTSQFNKDFIKNYNEDSDEAYFPEVDVKYLENSCYRDSDLQFLSERMKM